MLILNGRKGEQKRTVLTLCSVLILLIFGMQALSADDKPAKLFSSEDTLNVTITGPWRDIKRNKENQRPYSGKIEFRDDQGKQVTLNLTLERRGITRQRVCEFPPIRLRFKKEEVKGTVFRGQDSLKMVTHCENAERFEQYYILEMLSYRMYNLITDFSFRVRPLNVTYVDSNSGKKDEGRFAFVIEDDSDVAKRHDMKKIKIDRMRVSQLVPRVASEMSLFQYMIANTDWSALDGPGTDSCCHNSKLIGPEPFQKTDKAYPIPYDFDSSGLVNAHYAVPPNGLPIRSVRQRLYRGYCAFNDELEAARQLFLEQEAAIYALLENEDRLFTSTKSKSKKYIGGFFKIIKNPRNYEKKVVKKCRK